MAIRKVISRSIEDSTVAAIDLAGIANNLSLTGVPSVSALSSTISSTATDVFVYDTRKDSDGGAWRKRCQHTSWYNETLNTATRGSRRDFPAVAVIVATQTSVTIYDADDSTLPMWMVFTINNNYWLKHTSSTTIMVSALNGTLVTGGNGSTGRLSVVEFIADRGYVCEPSYNYRHTDISKRNTNPVGSASGSIFITNISVLDVAMTVMPSAPVDPATGISVPTIAVATDAGVSIIHNNGIVVNWLTNIGNVTNVSFVGNGIQVAGGGGVGYYQWGANSVPWFTTNSFDYSISDGSWSSSQLKRFGSNGNSTLYKLVATKDGTASEEASGSTTNNKLMIVAKNDSSYGNSLVSYITSSYNTGWMHGDIKGAWLSDSVAGTVSTPTNLISNGTFTSGVSSWGGASLTWDSANQRAQITGSALYGGISQTFSTTPNKSYYFKADVTCTAANQDVRIQVSGIGLTNPTYGQANTVGTTTIYGWVHANTTQYTLQIIPYGANYASTFYVDNVVVWELEADRSYNGRGLQVAGTITKTAIDTNNDLVAYSGWSGSNYMIQPYNSSLTFGTGDFCIMAWFKTGLAGTYNEIVDIAEAGTNNGRIEFLVQQNGALYLYGGTGSTQVTGGTVVANTWNHCVGLRRNGVMYVYLNGVLVGSGLSNNNFNNTNVKLYVGVNYNGGNSTATDQMALLRISATAPSSEQIAKIYNDEKYLFETGAKGCLYGTNDQINATAYDSATNLLHVGTFSGRSVFNGLRRVENTSTSVSTSISASNGFVVEQ